MSKCKELGDSIKEERTGVTTSATSAVGNTWEPPIEETTIVVPPQNDESSPKDLSPKDTFSDEDLTNILDDPNELIGRRVRVSRNGKWLDGVIDDLQLSSQSPYHVTLEDESSLWLQSIQLSNVKLLQSPSLRVRLKMVNEDNEVQIVKLVPKIYHKTTLRECNALLKRTQARLDFQGRNVGAQDASSKAMFEHHQPQLLPIPRPYRPIAHIKWRSGVENTPWVEMVQVIKHRLSPKAAPSESALNPWHRLQLLKILCDELMTSNLVRSELASRNRRSQELMAEYQSTLYQWRQMQNDGTSTEEELADIEASLELTEQLIQNQHLGVRHRWLGTDRWGNRYWFLRASRQYTPKTTDQMPQSDETQLSSTFSDFGCRLMVKLSQECASSLKSSEKNWLSYPFSKRYPSFDVEKGDLEEGATIFQLLKSYLQPRKFKVERNLNKALDEIYDMVQVDAGLSSDYAPASPLPSTLQKEREFVSKSQPISQFEALKSTLETLEMSIPENTFINKSDSPVHWGHQTNGWRRRGAWRRLLKRANTTRDLLECLIIFEVSLPESLSLLGAGSFDVTLFGGEKPVSKNGSNKNKKSKKQAISQETNAVNQNLEPKSPPLDINLTLKIGKLLKNYQSLDDIAARIHWLEQMLQDRMQHCPFVQNLISMI